MAKKKKAVRQTKVLKLYLRLLEINKLLSEVTHLYDEQSSLLEEIYEMEKGAQLVEIEGELRSLEVVAQTGHYVFNKPLRLSNKKG